MADVVLDLPDGDVGALLPHLEHAAYINIRPGVDADDVAPQRPLTNLFASRGPRIPLATWTPTESGLQHGAGPRIKDWFADEGHAIPDDWYVVEDHPRRGLVIRTYASSPEVVLRWLVRAVELTCPFDITEPWRAEVTLR